MYSTDRFADILEFETFLFRGVPETAEQMFETEFFGYVDWRLTRRELISTVPERPTETPANPLYALEFDPETGDVRVIELGHDEQASTDSR